MKNTLVYLLSLYLIFSFNYSIAQKFNPGVGKTRLLIGQNWQDEYEAYIDGTGKVPAGSGHYGSIYLALVFQGDDVNDRQFINWVDRKYPGSYVNVAISIKDGPNLGGYGSMDPGAPDYDPSGPWLACKDIANGVLDANIDQFSEFFKSYPNTNFFVRVGFEISIPVFANNTHDVSDKIFDKYTAQGFNCIENADQVPEWDLNAYRNAYNRIVNRMKQNGVNNVAYVYHPVRSYWDAYWLYPGDQNVDYVALSFFNHDLCLPVFDNVNCPESQIMDANSQSVFDWAKYTLNKPLIIAESSAQNPSTLSNAGMIQYIDKVTNIVEQYDVKAWMYINMNWPDHNWNPNHGWGDTRIQNRSTVLNHWLGKVNSSRYIHYTGNSCLSCSRGNHPVAPSYFEANASSSNSIACTWRDDSNNESGFKIERWNNGTYIEVGSVGANVTSFTENNISTNIRRTYRVKAYNSSGESGPSNIDFTDGTYTTTPTCSDGIQNQDETGIDCGGSCPPCAPENILESLNFESGIENWVQVSGSDSHDWTIKSGSTPSNNTGPSSADQGSYYAYLETSSGSAYNSGNNARLKSPSISGAQKISFSYHMLGGDIGELFVDINANGSGWTNNIWSKSGNQGDQWQQAAIDIGQYSDDNVEIRFRAVADGGWQGDIAIDNIIISGNEGSSTPECTDGCPPSHPYNLCGQCWESEAQAASGGCNETCDDPPPTPTCSDGIKNQGEIDVDCGGPCPACQGSGLPETLDFESGVEDWTQVSGFDSHDWTIKSGSTPSNNTGPSSASQGSYYAFLETSSGSANSSGDNARLVSPSVSGAKSLTFDYHMLGNAIGTLNVDVQLSGSWNNAIWSKSGNQGSSWQSASVDLSSYSGSIKVRFHAIAAGGWQGDIAIDDIVISDQGSNNPTCSDGIQNQGETGVDCGGPCPPCGSDPLAGAKLLPPNKKVILSIGQDLTTIWEYQQSGHFPTIGATVGYLAFYSLTSSSHPMFGGLGEDMDGNPIMDIHWGAGPVNAHSTAYGYPNSALVLALGINEGNDSETWCSGCLAQIGAGQWDHNIRRLAKFCKDYNEPVYLRIGYEFDGKWNHGYGNTTNYKNAYRRIVDIMRQEGANKVAFVWQSSTSPIDDKLDGHAENIEDWWPGDSYVDWLGLSWFLLPDEAPLVTGFYQTQKTLADEIVNLARSKNKPVFISESSPQGYDLNNLTNSHISYVWDGDAGTNTVNKSASTIWNEWFSPYLAYIHNNADVIRGVTYINTHWDSQSKWQPPYPEGYWGDARLQQNSTIRNNWKNEINTSFWYHGSPSVQNDLKSAEVPFTATKTTNSSNISIYPVPAKDYIELNGAGENTLYTITDITGAKIVNGYGNHINITEINHGIYFLIIDNNQTFKFMKH